MNEQVKTLWVKALKSGEFKQISGRLASDKGYCALGILAVLAMTEGICTYNTDNTFDGRKKSISYNIMKWAEVAQFDDEFLEENAGQVKFLYKGKETSIAELNDNGLSFKEIADVIEKHWKEF